MEKDKLIKMAHKTVPREPRQWTRDYVESSLILKEEKFFTWDQIFDWLKAKDPELTEEKRDRFKATLAKRYSRMRKRKKVTGPVEGERRHGLARRAWKEVDRE